MIKTSEAITLRLIPYSETSLISRVYTKEQGKVSLMAKGARRSKTGLTAILEPASLISTTYFHKDNRSMQTIKEACFIERFSSMKNNFTALNYGLAVVEILDKTSHDNDPVPILFRLINSVLAHLDIDSTNKDNIFGFFLYQFALRQGFKPEIKVCSNCNAPFHIASFDNRSGELSCNNCNRQSQLTLENDALRLLSEWSCKHLKEVSQQKTETKPMKQSLQFLIMFLKYHIEGMQHIKSLNTLEICQ